VVEDERPGSKTCALIAPILYDEHDRTAAQALRISSVAKTPRSPAAPSMDASDNTPMGLYLGSNRPHPVVYPCLTPLELKPFDLLRIDTQ
jgi:hypothetical protein